MSDSKSTLRKKLLARRSALVGRGAANRRIAEKVFAIDPFIRARSILAYLDFRDEVETGPIIARASELGKTVFVPYCDGDELKLFELRDNAELARGRFGILEPLAELRTDARRHTSVEMIDLIVVPGIGFDRFHNRLGFGGGFYDRLLKRLPVEPEGRPFLLALAFDCQIVDQLPTDPHDRAVDRVVTETRIL
jgi:5-formyltetrahydrofolate cyclo-ligase